MSTTICNRCLKLYIKHVISSTANYNRIHKSINITGNTLNNSLSSINSRKYTTNRPRIQDKTEINIEEINELEAELLGNTNHNNDNVHQQQHNQFQLKSTSTGYITQILSDVIHVSGLESVHLGAYVRIYNNNKTTTSTNNQQQLYQLHTVYNTDLYGNDINYNLDNNDNHIGGVVIAISDKTVIVATCVSQYNTNLLTIGQIVKHYAELPAVAISDSSTGQILNSYSSIDSNRNNIQSNIVLPNSITQLSISLSLRCTTYDKPLITGITQIDFFNPIVYGINYGIFGSHNIGKSSLVCDIIKHIAQQNDKQQQQLHIIYVSINNDHNKFDRIYKSLQQSNALQYTTIYKSDTSDSILYQYLLPFTAVTHAEYLRQQHENVLIIYDNLSTHAEIYKAMTKRIDLPMQDIRNIHSKLLERTADFNNNCGSITSLTLVETNNNNIDITEQLASYVDYRLIMSDKLRKVKYYPAINVNSIIGKPAARYRSNITKSITTRLSHMILYSEQIANNNELAKQIDMYIDDSDNQDIIDYADKIQLLMYQKQPIELYDQIIIMYAACNQSLLSEIQLKQVHNFVNALIKYIKTNHKQLYTELQQVCQQPHNELSLHIHNQLTDIVAQFEQLFRQSL